MVKQALNGRASKYPLSAQTVPMEVALANKQDPALQWPGAPPNWGQPDMPHIFSFVGRYGLIANSYAHADESLIHNAANAEIMRNEPMIMECIEARMRCVALLNWHIQPVDNDVLRDALDKTDSQETAMAIRKALKKPKSDAEKIADKLTSILRHTPHFMKLRYSLMDAIWYGKTATCQTMGVRNIGGQRRIFVRKWEPRHGDKLIFRYADESYEYDPEQVGIRIGPTTHGHDDTWVDYAGFERKRIDPTQHGLVYWFDGQQRRRMCIHRHIIEDGDFMRPEKAGSIQGIGIRSRIYWTWWAYQECLKLLLEYVERSALGIEIWKYPAHDPKAKERTEQAAANRGAPGRSVVLVPVPTGEYGDMYGVQIVEPGLGGINELQNVLQEFFGHKIKRYILGQVLTSEAAATGMGSGVADAHLATFHDIVRFDGLNLEETITTDLLRPLQQWNFPGTDDIFLRFVIDTESPDAQERIGSYQAAWSMGLKIRTEDMYDALGAAPPAEGEEYLSNPGMEGAMLANEAQRMQMAQMEAQMQAQPAMFGPFPQMGGVPGDGDGDGMANDEQAQQFQARAKVDRYAVKKNSVGTERYELKTNLSDEHHKAIADWIMHGVNTKGLGKFSGETGYAKLGIPHNHPLTGDDQHLIMFHTGNMGDIGLGKKVWGDSYSDQHLTNGGPELPDMDLRSFASKAARGILYHGIDQRKQAALDRVKDAKVVSFNHPDRGRQVLHPAVRKDAGSPWQLTQMSSHDGKPWGHHNPKDFTEGVHEAIQSGYEVEWTDKDGTKAPFSATGDYWLEVERFGRVKPMAGQRAFNWDEEQHPRETEEHDGKKPGEFAPKGQAETKPEPEADHDRQKLLDEARAARKWTNNGDGTYTAPNGTIWRKATAGGEESPVNGKWFAGGALMPIHGLAEKQPKPEPKPKRESLAGANTKEWKAPKVRQLSESEIAERREEQERQRRWDAVRPELEKVLWMGEKAGHAASGHTTKQVIPYLKTLKPAQVQAIGQQLRAKWIEREVGKYFKPGQNETTWRDEPITRSEAAKRIAEQFDDYANTNADYFVSSKLRREFPGIEQAVQGLKSYTNDDRYLDIDRAEELAAILRNPVAAPSEHAVKQNATIPSSLADAWRSSERWGYHDADEWAHANDADPADFENWVKLRDKVQSVTKSVPPELQFHLWDWLNEQADGDIPAGWKQAEKQLGAQLGIYRPWSEDDAKAVEFTSRGQRAAKPLFKLGGQSFALDDKRLQELQTQRYGQMFFDFDKPAKQPAQEPEKSTEVPAPEPPANSFAAKFKRYLDLQQDAAKRGLKQPRTNLLK